MLYSFQNKEIEMSFQVLIALLNIAVMIIIKEGSGYALQNEKNKCDSLIVGYSSIDHGKLNELSKRNHGDS